MCDPSFIYTDEDIFDEIATIRDPEKTYATLADLNVVSRERCQVTYNHHFMTCNDEGVSAEPEVERVQRCRKMRQRNRARVTITLLPTVPHCHLMHWICLSVVARLRDVLPVTTAWQIVVKLLPGSHQQWEELERQAQDKERVAAALDNPAMMKEIRKLINPFGDAS